MYLVFPGELFPLGILADDAPAVGGDCLPCFAVNQDEGGDASHAVLLRQIRLHITLLKGKSKEGHLFVVVIEVSLWPVWWHEHNLELLPGGGDVREGRGQHGGEAAARGAPVGGEVDADNITAV